MPKKSLFYSPMAKKIFRKQNLKKINLKEIENRGKVFFFSKEMDFFVWWVGFVVSKRSKWTGKLFSVGKRNRK